MVSIAKAKRYCKRLGKGTVGSERVIEALEWGPCGRGEGFGRALFNVGSGRWRSDTLSLALRADDLGTQRRMGSSSRLAFLVSNGSASARATPSRSRYLRRIDQPAHFPPSAQ